MVYIEVEQYENNELERETWRFRFDEQKCVLLLSFYRMEARLSKRHKWNTSDLFYRYDTRRNTITIENVPLPADVKAEALKQFIARLDVIKE